MDPSPIFRVYFQAPFGYLVHALKAPYAMRYLLYLFSRQTAAEYSQYCSSGTFRFCFFCMASLLQPPGQLEHALKALYAMGFTWYLVSRRIAVEYPHQCSFLGAEVYPPLNVEIPYAISPWNHLD